ncbi:MAG TPA: UTP--glucose-1-phosphate uridylyltransferase, partial [bacterium]|nr:UTP--glucose-1-phosphate uridylyltransferase [bacterium]
YILVDAITELMKERPMYAVELDGRYHDTGSKLGWLEANIAFALKRPDLKEGVKKMLKKELGK